MFSFALEKIHSTKHHSIIWFIILGIVIGNISIFGISFFEPLKTSSLLDLLAEIAVSFFLFRIAFGFTLTQMREVGFRSFIVAMIGVVASFTLGLYFGPFIIHGLSTEQYIFIAAALTTTSVGITAGILKDIGKLYNKGSRIVLGAALIDDIVSLFILAAITSHIESGLTTFIGIKFGIFQTAFFLVIGAVVARLVMGKISRFFAHYPVSIKVVVVLLYFVFFFTTAQIFNFSTIVVGFIAGLVLERHFFNESSSSFAHGKKVELVMERLSNFLLPIFFGVIGLHVNLGVFVSLSTLKIALPLLVIACIGKFVCALGAGSKNNPILVGLGMIPRGEVGLVFASVGLSSGILPLEVFSALIIVVITTTLFAPFAIKRFAY